MTLTSPIILQLAATPLSFHQIYKDLPFLLTSLIYCYLFILFLSPPLIGIVINQNQILRMRISEFKLRFNKIQELRRNSFDPLAIKSQANS